MIKSDGGSSSYYDLPQGLKTLNDLLEWKADSQWLGDSFHLSNLMKASWRWGTKEGTDKAYDARKIMYYGARLLMKYVGKEGLNKTLRDMLDDEQFRPANTVPTWDKGNPPPSLYGNPDPSPRQSKVIGSWRGIEIYDVHLWRHLLHAQKIIDDEFRRQGLDWRHL